MTVVDWLTTETFTPLDVAIAVVVAGTLRDLVAAVRRRRRTTTIDLPGGGIIKLRGDIPEDRRDAFVAEFGGKVRTKPSASRRQPRVWLPPRHGGYRPAPEAEAASRPVPPPRPSAASRRGVDQ